MTGPDPLTRDQLKRWATQVQAPTELPRLIRRLIAETTPELAALGMPAGEGASAPGWDGTVKATKHTAWVPAGLSLWEMSTNKNISQKASADYKKRLTTPDDSPTSEATYIALLLRPWRGREQWAKDRSAEGRWRQVLAYGLDDVDAWLEEAPVTRAWLAEQMGLHPYGYRAAEQWWNSWASQTEPNLPHALVLAGRDEQIKHLDERLTGEPQLTTVRGASLDEVLAFIVAVAQNPEVANKRLLARMAFVDRLESWRELTGRSSSLILIPTVNDLQNELPASSPHHIVVPVTRGEADIKLPRIDADAAKAALHEAGLPADRAYQNGRLARRSLAALRVHLSSNPELLTPTWAQGPSISRACRAVLLAGSWHDEQDGDQEIMCQLAGNTYENFSEEIETLRNEENPLLDRVDNSWHLVSIEDAWFFLREYLTKNDLERLREVCFTVLKERDPALDLEPAERWLAPVKNKKRVYSKDLRNGLARTLVLLSIHGAYIEAPARMTGTEWASYLVQDLLPNEGDNVADVWGSLADVLPLLAEAAPDGFLRTVQNNLENDSPSLAAMFTDNKNQPSLTIHSPHTYMLRSLEALAWSRDHYSSAIDILVDLDEIDPGGRLANRPMATIETLFCPWHISTSMPLLERFQVLDGLRERRSECAWRLMMALLSERTYLPTYEPEFRDWKTGYGYDSTIHKEFHEALVDRLLQDVAGRSYRFCDLLKEIRLLTLENQERIIDALQTHVDQTPLPREDCSDLRQQIRHTIQQSKTYQKSSWALPSKTVDRLESILELLPIGDPVIEHKWLFEDYLPNIGTEPNSEEYQIKIAKLRQSAIADIYGYCGLDGVLHLANECSEPSSPPWAIGDALWDSVGEDVEKTLVMLLSEGAAEAHCRVAQAYFCRQFRQKGWDWLESLLEDNDISEYQKARLLIETRDYPRTWEIVERLDGLVKITYWKMFICLGLGCDFEYTEFVSQNLLNVNRPCEALCTLGVYGIESEHAACLAAQALEEIGGLNSEIASETDIRELKGTVYSIPKIFDNLNTYKDAVGEIRLARLEWNFFMIFDFEPKALRNLILKDPKIFVEIISVAFRPEHNDHGTNDEPEKPESINRAAAMRSYSLLSSYAHIEDNEYEEIDLDFLIEWVTENRRLLVEIDRITIGEEYIGQILGSLQAEPGEIRPAFVVRDLLERIKSGNIERGIRLVISNSRGVTSRRSDAGGDQELELAAEYREHAQKSANRWPRTAKLLRELAESYERDARFFDDEAERLRAGINR